MPPTILIDALGSVRRRVRALAIVFGAGLVLACAVVLLLATVLLDYALNLPPLPRLVIIAASLAAIAFAMLRWIIKPTIGRLTLSDIAGRLETAFPQFDDRLRSTVDFSSGEVPGSEAMKDRVITEATGLAQQINLNTAIVQRPAWYSISGAAAALALLIVLWLAASPAIRGIVASRLLTPFHAKPWPRSVQIDLLGSVPQRVPVGQRIDVRMKLARGDRSSMKAIIFYKTGDGPVQQEYMTRGADATYAASLDARVESGVGESAMRIWMKSGDDQKELAPITVVPRLAITRVEAVVTPPKYAQLPASTINLATGPGVVVAGAQLELHVQFNKALAAEAKLALEPVAVDATPPPVAWTIGDGNSHVVGRWMAGDSVRFHVRATDADGFTNMALEEYELIVKPDQNPSVQIENPRRNEERTPEALVPLQAVAEDDFGIQSLKLVVDRLKDKKHWEIELVNDGKPAANVAWERIDGAADRQRFRANYPWELKQLAEAGLKSGDVLEYFLLAQDNYEIDGSRHAPVPSGKLRIAIISQEEFASRITEELRAMAQQVGQIKAAQTRTRQETSTLKQDTELKKDLDTADRTAAERLAQQQSTAASQSKQVAAKLDGTRGRMEENRSPNTELKQIATDVRDLLNQTAENPMKEATNQIAVAKEQNELAPRNEALAKALDNQDQANEQLQKALDRMGSVGTLAQMIDRIKALLEEQRKLTKETAEIGKNNLGKKPEQLGAEDRKRLEKNAAEQQKLSEKTEKMLAELSKQAESLAKTDPASSEAMKQAAQTGQQQQVPSNQSKAAQSARQNKQSDAQAAQKQAEIGLELILSDLREAERRKLEELAKKLEDMQQQIGRLVRRQAGHNLDNLSLQGPDRVSKLETKLLEDLLAKSERTKDNMPPVPDLGQLNNAQEQTERNTRDISKSAEELPGGAEPSALLLKAAGKMERAVVHLRESKLTDAYEPPQVEALAALDEAKKIIDEQKRAVDEKLAQQQREAIRLVYIKIKEDQEKLNGETVKIDKTPRLADGNLNRVDAIRLGQLPGEQGKLSDRTNELEERLEALGSIVYVWANKDIVTSMGQVKTDLAKPATGVPTQAEQIRIVEQLDSMIKSLAIKPIEKKFDARGGGGNCACKPGLPSEAELRLLKELQGAINRSTKTIDAQPSKDKEKLAGLGERQGSLRGLLDRMFQKASNGQFKLGPEPDNREQLPEEAAKEAVENQELEKELLTDQAATDKAEKDLSLVGDRMARSRQRLAINNDPGKTTQIIQERIQKNLDELIEAARQQQARMVGQPKQQNAQKQGQPKPGEAKPTNEQKNGKTMAQSKPNRAATPAGQSNLPGAADATADLSQEIQEKMAEWGGISKRQREAVIEGSSETIIEKYKKLVYDYYQNLAEKQTERK